MSEEATKHLDTLPVDADAEQSVLCWMLSEQFYRNDPSQGSAREFFYTENIHGELFWTDRHRGIFREIERRMQAEPPDPVDAFLMQERFDDLPTRSLLVELTSPAYCASRSSANHATERLRAAYKLRQLAAMGNRVLSGATSPDANPDELIAGAESTLAGLRDQSKSKLIPYRDAVKETLTEIEETKQRRMRGEVIGIPSGLTFLDNCFGGARKGNLIVIAGRPGEGKSAFALKWLDAAAESSYRVNFHSLEMGLVENVQRHIAMRGKVGHGRIRMGYINADDIKKINESVGDLANYQVWLNTHRPQTTQTVRADVFRTNPDLVIVDYLQIMNPTTAAQRINREREVSEMADGMKAIAMEFKIPVIMLSQLSREVERRQSREPLLSDLRESGNIEQAADAVIFIYRTDSSITDTRTILVAKQRNGKTDKFDVRFEGEYMRFDNLEQQSGDYYRDN